MEHLRKVLDKKSENTITVSVSEDISDSKGDAETYKGYIRISGESFVYYHRRLNKTFLNLSGYFDDMRNKKQYGVSTTKLKNIIDYYKDVKDKAEDFNVIMGVYRHMLYTYFAGIHMEISDHISIDPVTEETSDIYMTALDGRFISDFLKIASSQYEYNIELYINDVIKSAVFFSAGDYTSFILPKNMQNTSAWNKLQAQLTSLKEG